MVVAFLVVLVFEKSGVCVCVLEGGGGGVVYGFWCNNVLIFPCAFGTLCPSQQFFSHVRTGLPR